MVIGESRYFDLYPSNGVSITGYTAKCELIRLLDREVSITNTPANDGVKFSVKVQTAGLSDGKYELRVTVTDPSDGFVNVAYSEKIELTK